MKTLENAVIKQLEISKDDIDQTMRDVNSGGAGNGFTGFIYFNETNKFYRSNRPLIIAALEQDAEIMGTNLVELVKGLKQLDEYSYTDIGKALFGKFSPDFMYIYNALAWYALETVAYDWETKQDD